MNGIISGTWGLAAEEQRHFDALTEARIGVDTPLEERPEL